MVLQNANNLRVRSWQRVSFQELKVVEECLMLRHLVKTCETTWLQIRGIYHSRERRLDDHELVTAHDLDELI